MKVSLEYGDEVKTFNNKLYSDDYADYPESDDFLGAKKGYEIYNPFEGMETSISSNGDMVLSDTGGRSIIVSTVQCCNIIE